ncbi:hypothetical protein CYLTODRAFT_347742 [Cylindrobasidium torrendii FP15055 ss-10]|uniref:Lysophospholipase n=1 Tax=Cylindrobasidium torrendii FP15055 ss-10 TaxID=1314674 RepID=A0A0D7BJV4_9AGAR|nr:hypothetical protein CYLTODRAFT_347742 [Cylindrobasidium torrendii FP15055 ss-10]
MLVRAGLALFLSTVVQGGLLDALNITSYAPDANITCPNRDLVRVFSASNQSLHQDEVSFIRAREAKTADAWADWIGDGSALGYSNGVLKLSENQPRVGVAVSGGSYRASLYGAGVVNALDGRNSSSKAAGTGGLLQVSSYLTGLSGGSWLVSSLYSHDFPQTNELVFGGGDSGSSGWILDFDLFLPGGLSPDDNKDFYGDLKRSVEAKALTGSLTSLTDLWARALSYHMLNGTTRDNFFDSDNTAHGAGQLWSGIVNVPAYHNHEAPFPIIVVDSRPDAESTGGNTSLNALVYEFSPLEFASYDPNLSAGMDLRYMGSTLNEGKPEKSDSCVQGLDETGFVFGTSSSLFNSIIDKGSEGAEKLLGILGDVFSDILDKFQTRNKDVANWRNPFKGIAKNTFTETKEDWLDLIDGGLNGENVPMSPLFVKSRGLDMIVAVDASADSDDSFPQCKSLLATKERIASVVKDSHQGFPPIPNSVDECVSTGVNMRPTFFGCEPGNTTAPEYPLLVYLPNSPPLTGEDPATNTGTFKLSYTEKHQRFFMDQVHKNTIGGFKPNSNDADDNFGRCLQCAAVDRSRMLSSIERSSFCSDCFKQYCYDPANTPTKDALPNRKQAFVDPDPQDFDDFFERNKKEIIIGVSVGGAVFLLLVAGWYVSPDVSPLALLMLSFSIWCCCCRKRGAKKATVTTTYASLLPTANPSHNRDTSDMSQIPLTATHHQYDSSYTSTASNHQYDPSYGSRDRYDTSYSH